MTEVGALTNKSSDDAEPKDQAVRAEEEDDQPHTQLNQSPAGAHGTALHVEGVDVRGDIVVRFLHRGDIVHEGLVHVVRLLLRLGA
eukprot:16440633-Heterocapsa_arctica.AAC.1